MARSLPTLQTLLKAFGIHELKGKSFHKLELFLKDIGGSERKFWIKSKRLVVDVLKLPNWSFREWSRPARSPAHLSLRDWTDPGPTAREKPSEQPPARRSEAIDGRGPSEQTFLHGRTK